MRKKKKKKSNCKFARILSIPGRLRLLFSLNSGRLNLNYLLVKDDVNDPSFIICNNSHIARPPFTKGDVVFARKKKNPC